ncbi:MAG: hypothetical protein U5K54_05160 [Cytophagales bacterium]|nr:hypothetical protein [Cytophagales bacterium]
MLKYSLKANLLILFSLVLMGACKSSIQNPDKGVSFELNEQRKQTLSEVSYQLHLDIMADKHMPITGQVVISFSI